MNRFQSVRTTDLVRVKVGNVTWYVHRHWYTSYPWKVYGDETRKPKAALNGGGEHG